MFACKRRKEKKYSHGLIALFKNHKTLRVQRIARLASSGWREGLTRHPALQKSESWQKFILPIDFVPAESYLKITHVQRIGIFTNSLNTRMRYLTEQN